MTEWKRLAERVKQRDGQRCRKCHGRARLTVHHLRPRDQGGENDARNLITLCTACHDWAEIRTADGGLSFTELTRPPSRERGRRIWWQDTDGQICAYVLEGT